VHYILEKGKIRERMEERRNEEIEIKKVTKEIITRKRRNTETIYLIYLILYTESPPFCFSGSMEKNPY
jgi:hypothetical protein